MTTSRLQPRLLQRAEARRYLGGLEPDAIGVQPAFYRGEAFYDRALLDAKLDALSGIGPPKGDDADSDLAAFVARIGHGPA